MAVIPFPAVEVVQPLVEVLYPQDSASGLYEVMIWKNRDRRDGFMFRVPTHAEVLHIVATVRDHFEGRAPAKH